MKCADPKLRYIRSDGKIIWRNFSIAKKTIGLDLPHTPYNCGTCLFCRKKRAYELAMRCVLHASLYLHNSFLTLTYDEKKEGYHNEFQYEDIQKFKKRLRRVCKERIEIFNVHEYGKHGKKHWHLAVFNFSPSDKVLHTKKNSIPLYTSRFLERLWPFGFSTVGSISEASAMYQTQYMEKDFKNGHIGTKKKSHSKYSGIGRPYFEKHYRQILTLGYIPMAGKKIPIPRYFLKIAHRHYCHFFQPDAFYDVVQRKALYRPLAEGNRELADLFQRYSLNKQTHIDQLEEEWDDVISQYLTTGKDPDFIQSAQNALYDLKNKQNGEKF